MNFKRIFMIVLACVLCACVLSCVACDNGQGEEQSTETSTDAPLQSTEATTEADGQTTEAACRSKLTELVTYHVLRYIDRNEFVTVMNSYCMTHEIW